MHVEMYKLHRILKALSHLLKFEKTILKSVGENGCPLSNSHVITYLNLVKIHKIQTVYEDIGPNLGSLRHRNAL